MKKTKFFKKFLICFPLDMYHKLYLFENRFSEGILQVYFVELENEVYVSMS